MSWNYRVIKHVDEANREDDYAIHEVYYEDKFEGQGVPLSQIVVKGFTTDPVGPSGVDQKDLLHGLRLFMAAFSKPILVEKDGKIVGEEGWE